MLKKAPILIIACILFGLLVIGCSGNRTATIPDTPSEQARVGTDNHISRGIWRMHADPVEGTLDIIPLRATSIHLNALPLLEPPPWAYLTIESEIEFSGPGNSILDVDIGLKHPYPNSSEFAGFDVKGILISSGSLAGFSNAKLIVPDDGDTRLINADGHTRFWNPDEFPPNKVFGYVDGILGTPDSVGNYNATLNGYKLFTQGLGPDDDQVNIDHSLKCAFFPGEKYIRHYTIDLSGGFEFNYAIDACWKYPTGDIPYDIPDDFPPGAFSPEPYIIEASGSGSLYPFGGSYDLDVEIYDHNLGSIASAYVECPALFAGAEALIFDHAGTYSEFYTSVLTNEKGATPGIYPALITIEDNLTYDFLGEPYSAYKLVELEVKEVPDVEITLPEDREYKTIGKRYIYNAYYGLPSTEYPSVIDHDGPWDFTTLPYDNTTTRKALALNDPQVSGFAGNYNDNTEFFFKNIVDYGVGPKNIFIPEQYKDAENELVIWGVEAPVLGMSVPFDNNKSMIHPYPWNTSTDFHSFGEYSFIITLARIEWDTVGQGVSLCTIPAAGGFTTWAIKMRHLVRVEVLGQHLGTGIFYEWFANDGTCIAAIAAGNLAGELPNFDPVTYDIIGLASYNALFEIIED